MKKAFLISWLIVFLVSSVVSQELKKNDIANQIDTPEGYERIAVALGSFENYLRHLPIKKDGSPVLLHTGEPKRDQSSHVAVIDVDILNRNQECADAVIRLRAEYLYASQNYDAIHFNFTSGDRIDFTRWIEGERVRVDGNQVTWVKSATRDGSHETLKKYLKMIFAYAGSHSLGRELQRVDDIREMQIGDVFIQGGFPGHAIIVVDMAVNKVTGKKIFMVAQSYMPAQDIHILKNKNNPDLSPWYELDFGETLVTPSWTFNRNDLMRFPQEATEPVGEIKPRTIQVYVALCDNENQGIVSSNPTLENGLDPGNNQYWGAMYGIKSFFSRSGDWQRIKLVKPPEADILERVIFKHQSENVYLIADAYRGDKIKRAIEDFLSAAAGHNSATLSFADNEQQLNLASGGAADLVVYVGHNGLMDFSLDSYPRQNGTNSKEAIILACASKPFFERPLKQAGAYPLLWTTSLMAPEAYTLKSALDGWILNESPESIRERAAQAYHQYQRCGINAARRLLVNGF